MQTGIRSGVVVCAAVAIAASLWVDRPVAREQVSGGEGSSWGGIVVVPPGVDALGDAVRQAPDGSTLLLKAGVHGESGTVLIEHWVNLVGEPGAVLESSTTQAIANPRVLDAALQIRGADNVRIANLEIRPPAGSRGNTGIIIEDARAALIAGNRIRDFAHGVVVQKGDRAVILANIVEADPDFPLGGLGVTVINGRGVRITGNRVSSSLFGIWACDHDGVVEKNTVTMNTIGVIGCRVPEGSVVISGVPVGSSASGTNWSVRDNIATGNGWGYLMIDGASGNRLSNNEASDNAFYDIELAGDSYRFGFLTPTSSDNLVSTGGRRSQTVKDCGLNNRVTGAATRIDTSVDPCF